jgi:hypothetical protein
MDKKPFNLNLLRWIVLLGLVLTGCSQVATAVQDTPRVVTVVVEVTSTPLPATPTPPPTATATPASPTDVVASPSLTPTDTATSTSTATATLRPIPPSITPILLLNVPIEGGDQNHKFYVMLVYPNFKVVGTAKLWFRVYAHYPMNSKKDGEGIDNVEFTFSNSKDVPVYDHVEKTAGYCAFMGGEPDCIIWDLAAHNYEWPNGTKIETDTYTLFINATTKPDQNGDVFEMNGQTKFKITVP